MTKKTIYLKKNDEKEISVSSPAFPCYPAVQLNDSGDSVKITIEN